MRSRGRGPSSPGEPARGSRGRFLLILIAAIGLCVFLWRGIDTRADSVEVAAPRPDEPPPSAPSAPASAEDPPPAEAPPAAAAALTTATVQAPVEPRIRLFGRVLESRTRGPVAHPCDLRASDEQWDEISAQSSGASAYVFEDLAPGEWTLTAACAGYLTRTVRVVLEAGETVHEQDVFLDPAFVLQVRIDTTLPKGVTFAEMKDRLGLQGLGPVIASALTSRDDSVSRELATRIRYFYPSPLDLHVIPTLEEPGSNLEVDLKKSAEVGRFRTRGELPEFSSTQRSSRGRVRQRTVDESGRVAPVMARSSPSSLPTTQSDLLADGRRIEDLPPEFCGVLELAELPPVYASLVARGCVLGTAVVPAGAMEVTIPLDSQRLKTLIGQVRLTVLDEQGTVLRGIAVDIDSSIDSPITEFGADGSITIVGLLPGPARLSLSRDGCEPVEDRVFVLPGRQTELGSYRLTKFSRSEIRVLGADGEPESVSFNVFPEDRYASTREILKSRFFRSSPDGTLKVDSVGRGRYLVVANDEDWTASPTLLDTAAHDAKGLEIRVSKPTSVAFRMRADPPVNGRLSLRTSSGVPVAERPCRTRDPIRFTLAPGAYTVELFDGETWLWSEGIAVGAEPVRQWLPR